MAMSVDGMLTAIKEDFFTKQLGDATAFIELAAIISKYVCENAEADGSFSGLTVVPKVSGKFIPLQTSLPMGVGEELYVGWLNRAFKDTLTWMVQASGSVSGVSGKVAIVYSGPLPEDMEGKNTPDAAWELICEGIIESIKKGIIPSTGASGPGGAGVITWNTVS